LAFNDQKPLDLDVNCGAGETRLDIGELELRHVKVSMGVGELRMDLHGAPKHDYDVSIHGGIGQATVYLPSDVGIEANAEGGIGDIHVSGLEKHGGRYVNQALGKAQTTIRLDIQGGIGEIRLIAD
jgi:predicted membrane protein